MDGCESWTVNKAECWRIDAFELWCWRRLLRVPWTARRSINPKGNQCWTFIGRTDAEAEAPILWPPDVKNWLTGKDPDAGQDWRQEEKGRTEDVMVGWRHWLGQEFEQALGTGGGQGGLACCSPWRRRVGQEWATELKWTLLRTGSDPSFHFWRPLFTLRSWSDTVERAVSEQLSGLATQVSRTEELVTWQCFKGQESGMHCGSF